MSEMLSPVKLALHEIRSLRARVQELESAAREPIAIVGMGLRFPGGVRDEASFWDLLVAGRDGITAIPRERWDWGAYYDQDPAAPGAMYTRHGGFLDEVDRFDAAFFGIAPREATAMDPQQRLLLEVAWEALENAGQNPAALRDTDAGVFVGIGSNDYGRAVFAEPERMDAYAGSGNAPGMAAGRLSYVLGLHGPSLVLDTSCSSSLVAVHAACQSLRAGDCGLALAGGVNLVLSPEGNIALSRARMMAPDGRCKSFDEAADGYVRAEGCGVVVLRRLADALRAGDRVLAVIRGSAVNHDGRSGGLTAPSGPAQEAVIRRALAQAGLSPAEIDYVEAHGTGTSLGDPIEMETLASVLGEGRAASAPLVAGSVKTNFGHAEPASGIAGLLKTVLALGHAIVPASLHLERPSTHIAWERIPVRVPSSATPWPATGRPHRAGVSSFGFSGTNAHIVLEEAPASAPVMDALLRPVHVLALSAQTETALARLRDAYARQLRHDSAPVGDLCFTANAGRAHFAHRCAVVGTTAAELADALEEESSKACIRGVAAEDARRIGYVFTGQGSQYVGMGRELWGSSAVFREALERCFGIWEELTGDRLEAVLYGDRGDRLAEAGCAQPLLFAVEYGLSELWRSWGIEPSVVLGHSLGEYVAAVVSGVFSVEDGLRLVRWRAELMDTLAEQGGMYAVTAERARVESALRGLEAEVGIAAVNGREAVVISGGVRGLEEAVRRLEAEGVRSRRLEVTHGFHSPLLEPLLEEFERRAREISYREPRLRVVSNVTGRVAAAGEMQSAGYWRRHMRGTVEFAAGLETLLSTGVTTLLEIGPQPHLTTLAMREHPEIEKQVHASLRRGYPEFGQMATTLARLYAEGHSVHWDGFDRGYARRRVALPTYPFERERYWHSEASEDTARAAWQRAMDRALTQSRMAPIGVRVEAFPAKWEALRRLTLVAVWSTLTTLGALRGDALDAETRMAQAGIAPGHRKLVRRWLDLLCQEGWLEGAGTDMSASRTPPPFDLEAAWREAEDALEDDLPLLAYLRQCVRLLPEVVTGRVSPLETLFPGGDAALATDLYERSAASRYANPIVAAAAAAVCASARPGRRLRILEVGGGTGATTATVLPELPQRSVSYHFTDVSESFLVRAAQRFAGYPSMRYGLLDIESDDAIAAHAQGYDVVIAANVVHATRDLSAALARVKRLLAPHGIAILFESTRNYDWHEIATALIEGWQKSEDGLRGGRALLEVEAWLQALEEVGFARAMSVPETGSPADAMGLHVLLAMAPGDAVASTADEAAGIPALRMQLQQAEARDVSTTVAEELPAVPAAERREYVTVAVMEEIARVLRLGPEIDGRRRSRLMDLGLDSLMALELRNRLQGRLGIAELPATLIFDYPTGEAIAGYALERLGQRPSIAVTVRVEERPSAVPVLTAEEMDALSEEALAGLLRSRIGQ